MNIISIIAIGYIAFAGVVIIIVIRDLYFPIAKCKLISFPKRKSLKKIFLYFYKSLFRTYYLPKKGNKIISWALVAVLGIGIALAIDARFIEPKLLVTSRSQVKICGITEPIKVALVADIQAGMNKKTEWVEKIVHKIENLNPDLVLLGGDLIDNEGTGVDETQYLEPLKKLAGKYPVYYIMGNHEYGIGNETQYQPRLQTGDKTEDLIKTMKNIGIPLLRNQLDCPTIKNQNICIFGADDIWKRPINFSALKQWDRHTPLIFLVHNPDGILYWPGNIKQPSIEMTGHTHGGQVWLPFIGPVGDAGIDLGKKYYKGLNYFGYTPIYTTAGAGESGGPIRLFDPPEVSLITLTP